MANPEDEIEEDVGGVQGSDDDAPEEVKDDGANRTDGGTEVVAPDAGEIEWAGGLVKKAPGAMKP